MKLGVQIVGPAQFRRYRIVRDNDGVEEFWDGTGWSRTRGLLYAAEQHLAPAYEYLELQQTAGLPERAFVAQAVVGVQGCQDFSLQSFKEAMYAASRLHLNTEDHGKGPVPGSSTLIDMLWNEAEEVLQPAQQDSLAVRVFEVPVLVRVRSDQPFDVSSLKKYLGAATTFHLDRERFRTGLVPDLMASGQPVDALVSVDLARADLKESVLEQGEQPV